MFPFGQGMLFSINSFQILEYLSISIQCYYTPKYHILLSKTVGAQTVNLLVSLISTNLVLTQGILSQRTTPPPQPHTPTYQATTFLLDKEESAGWHISSDPYFKKQPLAPIVHFLYLPCGRVGLGAIPSIKTRTLSMRFFCEYMRPWV